MRAITAAVVVSSLLAAGAPAAAQQGPEYTENFSRTIRIGATGSFDLSNIAGDVVITGGRGDEARVQAVKRVRDRDEAAARALLRDLMIQVTERPGSVQIRTEQPSRRRVAAAVDYTVALPEGATVNVKTVSGNLRVSNIRGELRTESVSGDVNIAAVARLRALSAVSGDVALTDVEGEDVVASLVSGDFNARNLKARSFELQTVSGDIRLDAQCDRVDLKTISGDIEYTGRLARNGRYQMQSHSGDVRITPTSSAGFDLDATTFNGDIRSDFTLDVRGSGTGSATASANGFTRGRRVNRSLRGTYGDGGALLDVRTFSGDVVIVKR
jgi:DUF4097 and DUF4098 domain-containing protein YvlB